MTTTFALVTGAAGGLGQAIALHLAKPGRTLLLHYRSHPDRAEAVAKEVRQRGAEAVVLRADLAQAKERDRLMDEVQARTDRLALLVNSAGTYLEAALPDITAAQWQDVFDSTCTATFHITQRAVPLLRAGAPARV